LPIFTLLKSPLNITPCQTLEPVDIDTSPIMVAFGATQSASKVLGNFELDTGTHLSEGTSLSVWF